MLSCPITAQLPKPSASEFPVIVQANNTIKIYLSKDNALARLWTTTGILMNTAKTRSSAPREIDLAAPQGTYIIEIQYEESMERIAVPMIMR
jgi:hypothetical protein